jgi:hypothetical protein
MWMLCVDWLSYHFMCEYTWCLWHLRAGNVTRVIRRNYFLMQNHFVKKWDSNFCSKHKKEGSINIFV